MPAVSPPRLVDLHPLQHPDGGEPQALFYMPRSVPSTITASTLAAVRTHRHHGHHFVLRSQRKSTLRRIPEMGNVTAALSSTMPVAAIVRLIATKWIIKPHAPIPLIIVAVPAAVARRILAEQCRGLKKKTMGGHFPVLALGPGLNPGPTPGPLARAL